MVNKLHKVMKPTKKGSTKQKPVPVKIVSDTAAMPKEDNSWRARSDLETLQRAEEVKRDKERMRAAKTEAKKQLKTLTNVCK